MSYSPEAKSVAIAPKFTSLLSMFGSGFIVLDVLRREKKSTHHRLLLGMSLCDFTVSSWFFLTTWPIPSFENVYGAVGNWPVCIAQGFFSQFSLAVVFYNASLSVYYLFLIKYAWTAEQIRIRVEPPLHAFALAIGFATSVMGIPLNLYNNDNWECWISPFPLDCEESWNHDGVTNCIRGDNASLYRWLFYYMFLWISISVVTVNMILVYLAVLKQEKAVEQILQQNRTQEEQKQERNRENSRKVAKQGYWFCGAFYLTWIFPTITRLVQVRTGGAPFPLILVTAMFVPFQGFFNFLVYVMPRYKSYFRNPNWVNDRQGGNNNNNNNASPEQSQQQHHQHNQLSNRSHND